MLLLNPISNWQLVPCVFIFTLAMLYFYTVKSVEKGGMYRIAKYIPWLMGIGFLLLFFYPYLFGFSREVQPALIPYFLIETVAPIALGIIPVMVHQCMVVHRTRIEENPMIFKLVSGVGVVLATIISIYFIGSLMIFFFTLQNSALILSQQVNPATQDLLRNSAGIVKMILHGAVLAYFVYYLIKKTRRPQSYGVIVKAITYVMLPTFLIYLVLMSHLFIEQGNYLWLLEVVHTFVLCVCAVYCFEFFVVRREQWMNACYTVGVIQGGIYSVSSLVLLCSVVVLQLQVR